jgi:hypothetical protein
MCKCAQNSSQHQIIGVTFAITDGNARSQTLEMLKEIRLRVGIET